MMPMRIAFQAREIGISTLHCLLPCGRASDAFLQCLDAAFHFASDQINAEYHVPFWVGAGFALPFEAIRVCRIAIIRRDGLHIALPINANERDVLLAEPCEHVERDTPAPIKRNDAWRDGELAFEETIGFSLLRIMREAVADR
jgi:hypothetical protein